ncbi:2197_t:CDS:10 [Cetraspora pellucida]|uniref:2197_t:CDS:1 n=1 Tax=Cetraspora pellucida TaxID=1433469 RepID=A0ACA9KWK0_9GLOM|nr:2197_t:CDS:10 [Cetraspora pellucida]
MYTTTYGYPNNAYMQQSSDYYSQQPYPVYNNGGNTGGFWSAFGTGGFPGEPPLLDELGINFEHIKSKSLAVLNPLRTVDKDIMTDTDLAGPLLFCLIFGTGKVHFGYIYGVALLGCVSIYMILNLMSESGIDGYRTASVLGYCLLPLVLLSCVGVVVPLSGPIGLIASALAVSWCTYSSSTMFVTVLQMSEQRILVAYPVGMLRTRIYLGLGGIVFALAGDHLAKILEQKYPNTNPLIPDDSNKILSSQTPASEHFFFAFHNYKVFLVLLNWLLSKGKSSLTIQFVENHFVDSYYPTIENTFNKVIRYRGQEIAAEIIDTAGQDEHSILNSTHGVGIHGYILVYSITSRQSFEMVKIIRDKILNFTGRESVPIVLVGNKTDLHLQRQVAPEEGRDLASLWHCAWTEASAKHNENITRIFELMISEIEKNLNPNGEEQSNCIVV